MGGEEGRRRGGKGGEKRKGGGAGKGRLIRI